MDKSQHFQVVVFPSRGPRRIDSYWATRQMANMRALEVVLAERTQGPNSATITVETCEGWDSRVQSTPKRGWPQV